VHVGAHFLAGVRDASAVPHNDRFACGFAIAMRREAACPSGEMRVAKSGATAVRDFTCAEDFHASAR